MACSAKKRLYLNKHRRDLLEDISEQQYAIFQGGTDAGIFAQELFPNGIDASPETPYLYQKSVALTQNYIMTNDVIYEACFQFGGVICAIDILIQKNGKWYAFEVKGTNDVKPQHIQDVALQYYVITQSGLNLEDISIIHFDRDYVRRGDIDVNNLFKSNSVLEAVLKKQDEISQNITLFKNVLQQNKEPDIEVGEQCMHPYECPFINYCWQDKLTDENGNSLSKTPNVQFDFLKEFMDKIKFPIYFFDFETYMNGIPLFNESRPFQQIPFQYSLHVLSAKNKILEHFEYLGNGIDDPRETLINQLIQELGKNGSIITWNMTFEKMCINQLIRDFPKYEQELSSINERIEDLMIPFKKKWIDIPACEGSASIKKVLPAFIPDLTYDSLEIQDGLNASFMYSQLRFQSDDVQALQKEQLLAYCNLDTLAMVKIYERIISMM